MIPANENPKTSDDKYHVESTSVNDLDGCAATEATGLIPSAIHSKAELESYKNLYPFSPDEFVES